VLIRIVLLYLSAILIIGDEVLSASSSRYSLGRFFARIGFVYSYRNASPTTGSRTHLAVPGVLPSAAGAALGTGARHRLRPPNDHPVEAEHCAIWVHL